MPVGHMKRKILNAVGGLYFKVVVSTETWHSQSTGDTGDNSRLRDWLSVKVSRIQPTLGVSGEAAQLWL